MPQTSKNLGDFFISLYFFSLLQVPTSVAGDLQLRAGGQSQSVHGECC
jgi:hypothetical protein